jgi:hypothetical protein
MWGRDEDYSWYSTGDAANHTDLASGVLGEGTLQARYCRGALDDKPFTLGKYESVRIRATIAELAANGGAPMGFYTNFQEPDARREIGATTVFFGVTKRCIGQTVHTLRCCCSFRAAACMKATWPLLAGSGKSANGCSMSMCCSTYCPMIAQR